MPAGPACPPRRNRRQPPANNDPVHHPPDAAPGPGIRVTAHRSIIESNLSLDSSLRHVQSTKPEPQRAGRRGLHRASIPSPSVHSILLTLMARMSTYHLVKLCAAKRLTRDPFQRSRHECGDMERMEKACGLRALHKPFTYQVLRPLGRERSGNPVEFAPFWCTVKKIAITHARILECIHQSITPLIHARCVPRPG